MAFADKKRANSYNTDYKRDHYDMVRFLVGKGSREVIKQAADSAETTMSVYIKGAVADRLRADGFTVPDDF